jgi:ABC-type lipoprotein export system ATPase subunit
MVLSKVSKVYGLGEIAVHALRNVDFRVDRGDYLAIMGSSGSGTSCRTSGTGRSAWSSRAST